MWKCMFTDRAIKSFHYELQINAILYWFYISYKDVKAWFIENKGFLLNALV